MVCGRGHSGDLCAECAEGWASSSAIRSCVQCWEGDLSAVFVALAGVAFLVILVWCVWMANTLCDEVKERALEDPTGKRYRNVLSVGMFRIVFAWVQVGAMILNMEASTIFYSASSYDADSGGVQGGGGFVHTSRLLGVQDAHAHVAGLDAALNSGM